MLAFSYMVLGLNLITTFIHAVSGNIFHMLLGIGVTIIVAYYVWKESQNA